MPRGRARALGLALDLLARAGTALVLAGSAATRTWCDASAKACVPTTGAARCCRCWCRPSRPAAPSRFARRCGRAACVHVIELFPGAPAGAASRLDPPGLLAAPAAPRP
ncbi:MAG: hypothetical protein U1F21_05525 [Sphaerotilus natans]